MFKIPSKPLPKPEASCHEPQPDETQAHKQRMHGSGISEKEQHILDTIDQAEDFKDQEYKPQILRFERACKKNTEMRSKHPDNPVKYIESEAELAIQINLLQTIIVPELLLVLLQSNTHISLLALLSHENTDIAIACVKLLNEFTDDDQVESTSVEILQSSKLFVDALIKNDLLALLVQNLARLDVARDDDKQGVFDTLSLMENMIGIDPKISDLLIVNSQFVSWLLETMTAKTFDSLGQYASELLSVLTQTSPQHKLQKSGAIDSILQVLARYRRKDPVAGDEVEYMENLFNILSLLLSHAENRKYFIELEGFELMVLMLKDRKMSRMRAIKVIDHALTGASPESAEYFINAGGLSSIFPIFMQKGYSKFKKTYSDFSAKEDAGIIYFILEHAISIIASLFRNIETPQSMARISSKISENDFEKLYKLIELFTKYQVHSLKTDLELEKKNIDVVIDHEADYIYRLGSGLYTLQMLTLVLISLASQQNEFRRLIVELLEKNMCDLDTLFLMAQEYVLNIADGKEGEIERSRVEIMCALMLN